MWGGGQKKGREGGIEGGRETSHMTGLSDDPLLALKMDEQVRHEKP